LVELRPNDTVVVFTDGITESMDAAEAQFGRQRILETLATHRGGSAREIGKALLEAVAAFSRGTPQSDDRTLLVVKRLSSV
jgi:sigma-B regulation protein RsbU (phosphoserine phosphatase)